jgi:CRISPR-associated protein Cas1
LIDAFLARLAHAPGAKAVVPGLPQGSPLSPMWANLVLAGFDAQVSATGFPLVRYSDDFVVLAPDQDQAWEAMRVASEAAGELGLSLGADKSAVMSFDEGFTFLGEDFGPRYPPALDDHRVVDPPRRVVYLGLQGSRARLDGGRLVVESEADQELLDVPCAGVERLVCFGAVGVSAGFRSWALANGVDLVFLSRRGSYLGHAWAAAGSARMARLRAQLATADDESRRMQFARAVVEAKIRKQLVLLQRLTRRENAAIVGATIGQLDRLLAMLADCTGRDDLMGMEGAAAREYFAALGQIVPDQVQFTGRSRQPPQDVVNAALSYGYAILLGETVSALCAAGLDPAIGLLHTEQDRRPSLALDLMEEFRPLVVDQVVVSAARHQQLRAEHGQRVESIHGVLLTRAGKETVIGGYERRMLQQTRGALPGFSGSLRRHLYRQAERAAAFVHNPQATWSGLSWR